MGYYLWKVFVLDGQGGIEYLYFFSILDQTCEFRIRLFELLKLKVAFKHFFICLALLGVESFGKFLVRNYELIQLWSKVFKFVQGVLFLGFRFLRCFRIYLGDASTIGVALAVYGLVGFFTALELPLLYIILKDLTSLGFNLKVIIIP